MDETAGRIAAGDAERRANSARDESCPDALDQTSDAGEIALDAEDRELVAAQTCRDVLLANRGAQDLGAAAEKVVAGRVTEGVIHSLQTVQVDREDARRMPIAPAALFFGGEQLVPAAGL